MYCPGCAHPVEVSTEGSCPWCGVRLPHPTDEDSALSNLAAALEGRELGGRYRLVAAVGSGLMGSVFRAMDTQLRQPVALKMLSSRHQSDLSTIKFFAGAAQTLSQLDHPNL